MSKKTKAKNKIEVRTEFALVKHEFTTEETQSLTSNLTKGLRNIGELQEQKKAIGAEYAAKIKTQQAAVSEIANKLDSGFEMKEMQCDVEYDYPSRIKRFYPMRDNGKRSALAKEEPMSEIDLQSQLPLKDTVKKLTKAEKKNAEAEFVDGEGNDLKMDLSGKPAKKPRKKKDLAPGEPLTSVGDAIAAAKPASHEMTSVRGDLGSEIEEP